MKKDIPECWLVLYSCSGQRDWLGQSVFDDEASCQTWIEIQRRKATQNIRNNYTMRPVKMVHEEARS